MSFQKLGRAVLTSLTVAAMLTLSACGSSEPTERKAFIEFLQTRIIDKSGVHIPRLLEPDKQKLGQYAPQYQIIETYHLDNNTVVFPALRNIVGVLSLSNPKAVMDSREKFAEVIVKTKEAREHAETRLAKAKSDFEALKQPDDLKPIYAAAFKRTVADPGELLSKFFVVIDEALARDQQIASFMEANKANIKFVGSTVEIADQKLLDEFNAHIVDLQKTSARLIQIQGEIRKLIRN